MPGVVSREDILEVVEGSIPRASEIFNLPLIDRSKGGLGESLVARVRGPEILLAF